jgi:glucuronosyltransferase
MIWMTGLIFRYRRYIITPRLEGMMRKNYHMSDLDAVELEENTTLILVNSHPATDFPEPLPPNIIPVAGLQIKVPKPLPEVV